MSTLQGRHYKTRRRHYKVNHSREFETVNGVHTNHVEGIHSVLKRDSKAQFARYLILDVLGCLRYLDLLAWRANQRIKLKMEAVTSEISI